MFADAIVVLRGAVGVAAVGPPLLGAVVPLVPQVTAKPLASVHIWTTPVTRLPVWVG